ncbi:hypothetical protein QBC41DRAFT_382913 [Cercophora samala]|uniref:Uncharacterized protein n=1 Tax=Cercophora samala TaxID=330535 RepID=A0AA39YZX9_9PEZI|nr:hypothetical protein QBC41DRAFT_382913 [Cercophora samala]
MPLIPPLSRRQVVMPSTEPPQPSPPTPPAQLGLTPTAPLDIPISSTLLLLFALAAAAHMAIFQLNRRRAHKFLFSALLFGFCMARIASLVMRIVWAARPTDTAIALAATVFVAAGVLLLYIVNLIFAQRVLRAYRPRVGWKRPLGWAWKGVFGSVVGVLVMVVAAAVVGVVVSSADVGVRRRTREVQLFAGVYLAVLAFAPVAVVAGAAFWPGGGKTGVEKFGEGGMRSKVLLLVGSSLLLTLGAAFRAGIGFVPRPVTDPAWYHSKAAFYCFNFGVELVVVYGYAVARFDRRFHVPDGSSGPGDYGKGVVVSKEEEVFGAGEQNRSRSPERAAAGGGVVTAGERPESLVLVEAVLQNGLHGKKEVSEAFSKGEV